MDKNIEIMIECAIAFIADARSKNEQILEEATQNFQKIKELIPNLGQTAPTIGTLAMVPYIAEGVKVEGVNDFIKDVAITVASTVINSKTADYKSFTFAALALAYKFYDDEDIKFLLDTIWWYGMRHLEESLGDNITPGLDEQDYPLSNVIQPMFFALAKCLEYDIHADKINNSLRYNLISQITAAEPNKPANKFVIANSLAYLNNYLKMPKIASFVSTCLSNAIQALEFFQPGEKAQWILQSFISMRFLEDQESKDVMHKFHQKMCATGIKPDLLCMFAMVLFPNSFKLEERQPEESSQTHQDGSIINEDPIIEEKPKKARKTAVKKATKATETTSKAVKTAKKTNGTKRPKKSE